MRTRAGLRATLGNVPSIYRRGDDAWELVIHRQAPLD
jgi:hypothetical protein